MRVYALVNQKGGVGKTAITINLAGALVEAGRRVVLIDWDPQGHLTTALGAKKAKADGANLATALLGQWTGALGELLQPLGDRLWIFPSSEAMHLLEPQMYTRPGREYLLSRVIDALPDVADDVLIDCPPSLGALTDAGLVAARKREDELVDGRVIIPVQAEDSSIEGLALLLGQIATVQQALGITIEIAGLVINLYDARRGRIVTSTHDAFQRHSLGVLATLKDRADLREAWRLRTTVVDYAPAGHSAAAFRELARALDPTLPPAEVSA